jgi:antitoxin VapB
VPCTSPPSLLAELLRFPGYAGRAPSIDTYRDRYYLGASLLQELSMRTAKIFTTGRSQAVRLPAEFRFDTGEVYIRRDPDTGDVVLSRRPGDWKEFFALADATSIPDDFLADRGDAPPARRQELDALFDDDETP